MTKLIFAFQIIFLAFSINVFADHAFPGTKHQRHQEMRKYFKDGEEDKVTSFWTRRYFTGDWGGKRARLTNKGCLITSTYGNDLAGNPIGGLKQGFTEAGSWNTDFDFDLYKIAGVPGLTFYAAIVWREGSSLTEDDIGNAFSVQQIYGGQNFRLVSLYLQERLFDSRLLMKIGRLSAGDTFLQSDLYYYYMSNAFCGNPIGVFFNTPSAKIRGEDIFTAYPVATWGAYLKARPWEQISIALGIYNANAKVGLNRYHGGNFSLNNTEGIMLISEVGYHPNNKKEDEGLPGNYRVGAFYVTGDFDKFEGGQQAGTYQYYFLLDQMFYRQPGPNKKLGLYAFTALLFAPENRGKLPFFMTSGVLYKGLFPYREKDVTAFGVAYGKFSKDLRRAQQAAKNAGVMGMFGNQPQNFETVLELNHRFVLTDWFYIQPDAQYIINPNGFGTIQDALVLGAQVSITF